MIEAQKQKQQAVATYQSLLHAGLADYVMLQHPHGRFELLQWKNGYRRSYEKNLYSRYLMEELLAVGMPVYASMEDVPAKPVWNAPPVPPRPPLTEAQLANYASVYDEMFPDNNFGANVLVEAENVGYVLIDARRHLFSLFEDLDMALYINRRLLAAGIPVYRHSDDIPGWKEPLPPRWQFYLEDTVFKNGIENYALVRDEKAIFITSTHTYSFPFPVFYDDEKFPDFNAVMTEHHVPAFPSWEAFYETYPHLKRV